MPSDEQLAFWAAIRASPLDDTPRLVYADWLQEHGDEERAEFIRLQCQIACLPNDRKTERKVRPALEHRERMLLTANRKRWAEPILRLHHHTNYPDVCAELCDRTELRRGFIHGFVLNLDSAYRLVTASPPLEPMDELHIRETGREGDDVGKLNSVASWENAGCFQTVSCAHADDDDVWTIIHGKFTRLSTLELCGGWVTDAGAVEIAQWAGASALTTLNLSSNRITDAGAGALANSPHLSGLKRLNLRQNRLSKASQQRLLARFGHSIVLLPDD